MFQLHWLVNFGHFMCITSNTVRSILRIPDFDKARGREYTYTHAQALFSSVALWTDYVGITRCSGYVETTISASLCSISKTRPSTTQPINTSLRHGSYLTIHLKAQQLTINVWSVRMRKGMTAHTVPQLNDDTACRCCICNVRLQSLIHSLVIVTWPDHRWVQPYFSVLH